VWDLAADAGLSCESPSNGQPLFQVERDERRPLLHILIFPPLFTTYKVAIAEYASNVFLFKALGSFDKSSLGCSEFVSSWDFGGLSELELDVELIGEDDAVPVFCWDGGLGHEPLAEFFAEVDAALVARISPTASPTLRRKKRHTADVLPQNGIAPTILFTKSSSVWDRHSNPTQASSTRTANKITALFIAIPVVCEAIWTIIQARKIARSVVDVVQNKTLIAK
jgi:hypothetical protein